MQGGSYILGVLGELEKRDLFFIRSIINRCHWVRPPFLMRHWSDSGAALKKNLLIRSWRRIRFSFLSPLRFPKTSQPTSQQIIYNVVPFARYRMRVWVSSWTFPTSFITQHPTVFLPPLKAFRLFFFFRFFLLLLLPTAITDSHNSKGKENIRKKRKKEAGL